MIIRKIKNNFCIKGVEAYEAKPLERKIEKWMTEGVNLENTSPQIYTARKDGVLPQYDIRTDRFAVAQDGMDKVSASITAKRQELIKINEKGEEKKE